MGQSILILGESGTGKTTSLRNFKADEIMLIKSINKNLPFRGTFDETIVSDNAAFIVSEMKKTKKKVIVVDDAQYIMSNEFFRRVKESGWDKFNDIASNFYKILTIVNELPNDVFVYFLSHVQKDENGIEKIKTIGRMLDEKLTIEGLFTVVLKTNVCDGVYSFQTQNSGHDTCKSPVGMFNNFLIDNDLKMVDSIIREYWGYTDTKVEEKAVAENAPSLRNPKVRITEEAKANVLKEAPVIEGTKTSENVEEHKEEPKSDVTTLSDTDVVTPTEVKEEVKTDVVETEVKVEQKQETIEAKPVSNEDKIAAIKAKLAALKK